MAASAARQPRATWGRAVGLGDRLRQFWDGEPAKKKPRPRQPGAHRKRTARERLEITAYKWLMAHPDQLDATMQALAPQLLGIAPAADAEPPVSPLEQMRDTMALVNEMRGMLPEPEPRSELAEIAKNLAPALAPAFAAFAGRMAAGATGATYPTPNGHASAHPPAPALPTPQTPTGSPSPATAATSPPPGPATSTGEAAPRAEASASASTSTATPAAADADENPPGPTDWGNPTAIMTRLAPLLDEPAEHAAELVWDEAIEASENGDERAFTMVMQIIAIGPKGTVDLLGIARHLPEWQGLAPQLAAKPDWVRAVVGHWSTWQSEAIAEPAAAPNGTQP